jgi:hypothetical protein
METKKCSKCKHTKNLSDFTKDKNRPDGLFVYCRECKKTEQKKEYEKNKERILNYQREYYLENTNKIKSNVSSYYLKNKEKNKENAKIYYQNNIESRLFYAKQYREKNKEKRNRYEKYRKETDIFYKLKHLVRNRISKFLKLKKIKKNHTTFEMVGCLPQQLKIFLEQKFIDGMSWDNQGKWHIDHIIPLSSSKTEEELYKLCHFTNLQPMWASDNIKKGVKIL